MLHWPAGQTTALSSRCDIHSCQRSTSQAHASKRIAGVLQGERTTSKLWLVDLAGSERIGKSGAAGARLQEATHINRSLSSLAECIAARCNNAKHVPFRNCKLTHLLQVWCLPGRALRMHSFVPSRLHLRSRTNSRMIGCQKLTVQQSIKGLVSARSRASAVFSRQAWLMSPQSKQCNRSLVLHRLLAIQDSLSGGSKVAMLLALNPCDVDAPESKCSLEFATRLRGLELGRAQRHVDTLDTPRSVATDAAARSGPVATSILAGDHPLPSHPITRVSSASSIQDPSLMSDHSAFDSVTGTDSAVQPSSATSSAGGGPASLGADAARSAQLSTRATPPAHELQAKLDAHEVDFFALQEQLAQAQVQTMLVIRMWAGKHVRRWLTWSACIQLHPSS